MPVKPVTAYPAFAAWIDVTEYGATGSGTVNDTAAIQSAIAALPASGGILYFPNGTYLITGAITNGALQFPAGTVVLGESSYGTIIKSADNPTDNFRMASYSGRVEVINITFLGPDTYALTTDTLTGIIARGSDNVDSTLICRNVLFRRLGYGMRGYDHTTNFYHLHAFNCEFDGDDRGLSTGEAAESAVMGILAPGGGQVHVDQCYFHNLGTENGAASNHSHCIYMTHDTPARITNSVFDQHIDGRMIQFFGNGVALPDNDYAQISNCYFGTYQNDNRAVHTKNGTHTLYTNCDFNVNSVADVEVHGDCTFRGCIFRGDNATGSFYQIEVPSGDADGADIRFENCIISGDRAQGIQVSADNVSLSIDNCHFSGDDTDHIRVQGDAARVFVRNSEFDLTASDDGISIDSTLATTLLMVSDCYFGAGGSDDIQVETGVTLTYCKLHDNYFGNGLNFLGTVTTEESRGNYGHPDTVAAGDVPTGTINAFGGTAPSGWLLCDGTAVSRTTYAALFSVTGEAFGVGDGSTTFNLPDLRDRFPAGKGTTLTTLGATGGSTTISEAQLPAHDHTLTAASVTGAPSLTGGITSSGASTTGAGTAHGHTWSYDTRADISSGGSDTVMSQGRNSALGSQTRDTTDESTHTHSTPNHTHTDNFAVGLGTLDVGGSTDNAGSGNAYWQPYQVVNYIIKT
jgi:microcystin-dependent protein